VAWPGVLWVDGLVSVENGGGPVPEHLMQYREHVISRVSSRGTSLTGVCLG
jgi:hypothetical protein